MRKPRVNTNPNANTFTTTSERIVEFDANDGTATGGLISFRKPDNGGLVVGVYRLDAEVTLTIGSQDDREPTFIKTPEIRVNIEHGKGKSVVAGPVRISFLSTGRAFVSTTAHHNTSSTDEPAVTYRDREYLAHVHVIRNDDGTWREFEPADYDVKQRGAMFGGGAPTTIRAAIVDAFLAAIATHWTPEFDRAAAYASASNDMGRALEQRNKAAEAYNEASLRVAKLRAAMKDNAPDPFETWKADARKLDAADLARHASVSTENNHTCRECFTCAAAEVLRERNA